jgi:hypothetical protein
MLRVGRVGPRGEYAGVHVGAKLSTRRRGEYYVGVSAGREIATPFSPPVLAPSPSHSWSLGSRLLALGRRRPRLSRELAFILRSAGRLRAGCRALRSRRSGFDYGRSRAGCDRFQPEPVVTQQPAPFGSHALTSTEQNQHVQVEERHRVGSGSFG